MITIYHNPRCSKSREGVAFLEKSEKEFKTVLYLEDKFSTEELTSIINKLGIAPIELVRKNESIWKEQYKGKKLSDAEVIQAMMEHPKLIERPIVVNQSKAVIGRPAVLIESVL